MDKPEYTPKEEQMPEGAQATEAVADPNQESKDLIERFLPGADVSTPEAIIKAQLDILKMMTPIYDKLYDLAIGSEEAAAFIKDLTDTGDVLKSLARNYAPEEIEAAIEAVKGADYEEDMKIHQGKVQAKKDRMSTLEANRAESQKTAQEFMDQVSPSDEDVEGFIKFYDAFISDALDNRMSTDHWIAIWNSYKHDDDVQEAEENGIVMGKNQKIVAQKASKEEEKKSAS
jgi:hypothetical protein